MVGPRACCWDTRPFSLVPGAGFEPARGCPRGIFLPTTAFAAARAFGVWTFSSPYAGAGRHVGGSRQVSTLSANASRLSSGLPPPSRAEVSPNLTPFTPADFQPDAQSSSPLRLPVSPPGPTGIVGQRDARCCHGPGGLTLSCAGGNGRTKRAVPAQLPLARATRRRKSTEAVPVRR
jgi:hypothetical protein